MQKTSMKKAAMMASSSLAMLLCATTGAQSNPKVMLEEIIVTAQKRAENIQDVPISATAFTQAQRELWGARNVRDLQFAVPNMTFSGNETSGTTRIVMRGIATERRNIGFNSGVGMYVDGVFQGPISAYNQDLIDIETMEILRGPQGTLFGRNTLAGAINITTQKPDLQELQGFVRAGYGNYDRVEASGTVSLPIITDKLAAKFGVSFVDTEGYVKNLYNDSRLGSEDEISFRGQIRLKPTESLTFDLSVDAAYERREGYNGHLVAGTGADPLGIGTESPYEVYYDIDNQENRDIEGASFTANYEFSDGYSLTSITAYRQVKNDEFVEGDRAPIDSAIVHFIDEESQFTQEIRVASPSSNRLKWVAGFYYLQSEDKTDRLLELNPPNPDDTRIVIASIDTFDYAFFGNAEYQITDRLSIFGGLRFSWVEKDLDFLQDTSEVTSLPDIGPITSTYSENNLAPTVGINFKLDDDMLTYLKFSRGFKSGGYNVDFVSSFDDVAFKSEKVSAYEAGFKGMFLDNRLRINMAAFYMDYTDQQVSIFLGNLLGFRVRNAGKSEIYGLEIDMEARPTEQLSLSGGFGYVHAQYTDFQNATSGGADYTGNRMQHAPKTTANFAATYTVPVGFADLVLRGEFVHRGNQYINANNLPINLLASKNRLNGRIGLSDPDGAWDVFVWGKNLTNEKDVNFRFSSGALGGIVEQVDPPRMYGITATYRY